MRRSVTSAELRGSGQLEEARRSPGRGRSTAPTMRHQETVNFFETHCCAEDTLDSAQTEIRTVEPTAALHTKVATVTVVVETVVVLASYSHVGVSADGESWMVPLQ